MKVVGLIPARMQSSRFPGKPLVDIEGMPMVIHVCKRAALCKSFSEVYIATDSTQIEETAREFGCKCIMTSQDHNTGTDRIAEAVSKINCDMIVNIQGDEPLVKPDDIEKLIDVMREDKSMQFATLVCPTRKTGDVTECKVVMDQKGSILYMSRADIPSNARAKVDMLHKLYCVIGFRKQALKKFAAWPQTPIEKIEYIEYLRILENGFKMQGIVVDEYTTSVDTPADLEFVKNIMKKDTIKAKYL